MNRALRRYIDAAAGIGNLTKANAERVARQLVKQSETAGEQVSDVVDDLMSRQRANRDAVVELVKAETKRVVHTMGMATTTEVEQLKSQLADLQRELRKVEGQVGAQKAAAKRSTTKKPTAKKSTAKSSGTKKTSRGSA